MTASDHLAALARRLEALLAERLVLIERLERVGSQEAANDLRLRRQLARLSNEQQLVLAELSALLPPGDTGNAQQN